MSRWKRWLVLWLVLVSAAAAQVHAAPQPAPQAQPAVAPTYTIFATRQGLVGRQTANGHIIQPRDRFVALPSRRALSPYGSHQMSVRLTYNGRTTVVPVWDVGPWNIRDDYWSPDRRYSDLPVGMPMAQAAYMHGYNGGRDEFGRRIRHPNGIDIADGAFWDDLGMTRNDWVQVTFLWMGADPGPGNATPAPVPTLDPPAPPTPPEEGAVATDDGGQGYQANDGPWYTARCGTNNSHTWTYSTTDPAASANRATWSPTLPAAGFYEVKAFIPPCGEAATTAARYSVTHDGAVTAVTVDQQAQAGQWVSLGVYHFGGEDAPAVELTDLAGDRRRAVRFDAVAWAPRTDSGPPDATIVSIARKDNGYLVTWGGEDDMSGIATYDVQVMQVPRGGWTDWQVNTAEKSAWFGPDEGRHFAFRVRARDWAGNVGAWPEGPDMTTEQVAP